MSRLRLGIEIRDFDLEHVGFALFVLDRGRRDGSGGYLRMSLDELSRFIEALRAADDVQLEALEPEPEEPADELPAEDPPVEEPIPASEPLRSADVITLPWLSKGRKAAQADKPTVAESGAASGNPGSIENPVQSPGEEPKEIRVRPREIRQPALF